MPKNPNGRLYSKSIHKYFLSIRILGRRTASAEATSVPLSSLSVLPSPLAGWIVRDKGEHHSDNYHGSCPSKFTMSTLYTLSLCCHVQVLFWLQEWFMNTPLMFHKLRSGLEAASALVGLASANPTRTPPSPQSLRTSLPTRSNWNNKFPCITLWLCLILSKKEFYLLRGGRGFHERHKSTFEMASL